MKNHDKIYIKDNPDLIKQWHFEKNNNLSPSELTLGSGKKAWWKCELGHEWEDTILHRSNGRNCPYCSNHRVLIGYNDLATTNPKLANEWNHEKNTDISIKKITAGSHKKVWWKCAKGHEWQSVVKERQQGNDCPYCSNKRILAGYNDLATTNPNLIREWNYERNTEITPQQISSGSSKKVWWRCEHGHEYLASISQRNKGNGCPYCANKKIIKGYNDLATIHPEIASEWCYEKNGSMTPYNSSPASGKMVWWKCDKGHEWQTPILNRHQGSGCPICSNQEILKGYNDLATTSPWLALEWNHKKNKDLNPTQVSSGSGKKVWWIGQCGHEWQAPISNRSQGTGCPICAKGLRISFPEKCVYFYIKRYFEDAIENANLDFLGKLEIDIYIPSLNVGIEYDGSRWHKDINKDLKKDSLCLKNGCTLYRIREYGCETIDCDRWIHLNTGSKEDLEDAISMILKKIYSNHERVDININRDYLKIYELMNFSIKEKSLENLFPELVTEWHPTKNMNLLPSQFSAFSDKKVWWLGKCGHEWEGTVRSRANGGNCPFCSNQRLLVGFNDLATTHPHLLREWDYEKNIEISPSSIFAGSEKMVWWKCDKGHEWQTYAYKRKSGENCPYCSNSRILTGYNDLATLNPELCEEWDYEKNKELTPQTVGTGSNQKVWWKCKNCGYEWKAMVTSRHNRGYGCKKCANSKMGKLIRKRSLEKNGNILDDYPELLKEWNYDRNLKINPKETTAHSNQKVWWICNDCNHEWQSTIHNKAIGHGCPECAKKRVKLRKKQTELQQRGSLLSNNPPFFKEWDYVKNTIKPEEIFQNSSVKVWWKCAKGHSYQASPNNRTKGSGCPYCSNRKILAGYNDLTTTNPKLAKEWNYSKNGGLSPNEVSSGSDKIVWWICSNCDYEWKNTIDRRNRGSKCPSCSNIKKIKYKQK